ncbi:hypothetical protein K438DRAFT_1973853 [Mycena galopus ATCC 62051]|nr:hypothetical protein K438DRAFT_1973853 [Mycena galopus ATCC 62051]
MQAAPHADKPLMEEDGIRSGSDHEIEVLDKGGDDDYSGPDSDEESVGRGKDNSESEEDEELDAKLDEIINNVTLRPKVSLKLPPVVFDLPFDVPYKNGTRDLTGLTSKSDFDDFLLAAAKKMETCISMVSSIGYIPSYKKPKPGPKLLDTDEAWDVLVKDVRQYIDGAKAKNRGKGKVPPFSILIVDMSEETSKATVTGKKGAKTKLKRDTEEQMEGTRPALKEHKLFKKLETDHHCQACKAACIVLDSGDHYVLTHTELATWAMLVSRHEATLRDVPTQLGLEVNHARQQRAKKYQAKVAPGPDPSMGWIQALAPVLGALLNNSINRGPQVPEWQPSQQSIHHDIGAAGSDPYIPISHASQPSSLGKRPAQDVPTADICPDIGTWLAELDSDPIRGRININYSQYNDILLGQGFFELSDLANVSEEQLVTVMEGRMNFGVANRLVTYAKADFAPFAAKRARVG